MEKYAPPFEITDRMLFLVSSVSMAMERLAALAEREEGRCRLRSSWCHSVYSVLKLESRGMAFAELEKVLAGGGMQADSRDCQEIRNARVAYECLPRMNPYSLTDLRRMHGIMERRLVRDGEAFRHVASGIYRGNQCLFTAPSPSLVPPLMRALFAWLRAHRDHVHPLILSSVFHYEMVLIHPFEDHNGRLARLWQLVLLAQWKPLFESMMLEGTIDECQEAYYGVIKQSIRAGTCNAFVEFMLEQILQMVNRLMEEQPGLKD